jgi:Acetyltransferase (GNAT) domain
MIVLDQWRGPLHDHLVFFAADGEPAELARRCRPYESFRIRHALGVGDVTGARRVSESTTSTVDLRPEPDEIYRSMDAKSCRYEIRRAEKLDDRLTLRRNDAVAAEHFLSLFNELVAWRYTKPLSQRRFEQYLGVSDVFAAYVDEEPVAGHLVIRDRGAARLRLVFSVSTRFVEGPLQKLTGPVNRWLHWREMLLYRDEGYEAYDFGGVNPNSPIGRFKLSFGGGIEHGRNVLIAGTLAALPLAAFEAAEAARRRRGRRAPR